MSSARQRNQFGGIEQPVDFVDVVLGQRGSLRFLLGAELLQQQLAERRGHPRVHLEPHHFREAAVADLLLDQAEQVFRIVVLVDLEVGVPGDAERIPAEDLHAREERFEMVADHQLQRHEAVGARERHPAGQDLRHLHPRETLLALVVPEHDRERDAQVRDVGEGMGRVDGQRRQDRIDLLLEVAREVLGVHRGELVLGRDQFHAAPGQGGEHILHQAATMLGHHRPDHQREGAELVLRRQAVRGPLTVVRGELLPEAGHPHLEELVEVGVEDAQKLEALEQGRARVQRLVQHAAIELQPGQLAVRVERAVAQVLVGGGASFPLPGGVGHCQKSIPGMPSPEDDTTKAPGRWRLRACGQTLQIAAMAADSRQASRAPPPTRSAGSWA